jgi:glycosyltransferase involved in cell wall biosynthesis
VKIAFCAYDAKFQGGPTVWMQRLLPDLVRDGFEVDVLLLHWDATEDCVMMPNLSQSGLSIRHLPIGPKVHLRKRIRWIIGQVREIRPDVFVAHHVVPAWLAARYIRRAGIPTVGVIHSDEDFYEALVDHFCVDPAFRSVDTLVAVSEHLKSTLRSRKLRGTRVERIPCGCPVPEEVRGHNGEAPLEVLYLGRLAQKQKRILDLADAFLAASRQLESVRFTICGDGPERAEVVHRLEEAKDHHVRLLDPVSPDDVLALMQRHDVFVLLSDYEGLPIALIEAMGCGLVPVCLRIRSGVDELIRDDANGILVADRGDSFVSALQHLRDHPSDRQRIGSAARETVLTEYASEVNHRRWSNLLRDLGNRARSGRIPRPLRIPLPPIDPRFRYEDSHRGTQFKRFRGIVRRYRERLRLTLARVKRQLATFSGNS